MNQFVQIQLPCQRAGRMVNRRKNRVHLFHVGGGAQQHHLHSTLAQGVHQLGEAVGEPLLVGRAGARIDANQRALPAPACGMQLFQSRLPCFWGREQFKPPVGYLTPQRRHNALAKVVNLMGIRRQDEGMGQQSCEPLFDASRPIGDARQKGMQGFFVAGVQNHCQVKPSAAQAQNLLQFAPDAVPQMAQGELVQIGASLQQGVAPIARNHGDMCRRKAPTQRTKGRNHIDRIAQPCAS